MNIYKLLKIIAGKGLPAPVKLMGAWAMQVLRRRNIGVFIDPVLACNLRCRMCYFSDPEHVRSVSKGRLTEAEIDKIGKAFFHRALKLQIGCGAEPTLFPHLEYLVAQGRKAGIPYISLTTNGQLIASGRVDLMRLAEAGLDELTLSLHGTDKETYEYLMPGAKYENLLKLTEVIRDVKARFPGFKLRVNFTVNSLNVSNLAGTRFWDLWKAGGEPDILQMRPVQNLGDSDWKDFNLDKLKATYDETIGAVARECHSRGITCIAPTREQIDAVDDTQDSTSAIIEDLSYCYISPDSRYKDDFREDDTFESYHRRKHTARKLFASVFKSKKSRERQISKKLNYTVD